ncbi:putative quinol monooxygenase YgiN [Pelotomaculum sp. FP]|uniref:putative quinol monooxygenase n=1 Tax=Pelotomaculum sp. FP TaxID=261474 RepID=UPI0010658834|nr:putative quinol monooxygenase [Pelotomaculum sp. FP]TEB14436.1 putative quinol monooxygenase YgiN [Pelotomaculum sp. FP]
MITLIAKLKAQPGKEALLADECVKLAKNVREHEQGCLMYIPHVSTENPAEIVFFEKYIDQEAFHAHGQTPYFKAYKEKCGELAEGNSKIQFIKELI